MALISFRRSARDHLQLCQLRELGENFVPHSTGKVSVGLLFAQVFKRKHSDRFFGQVARPDDVDLGFRRAVRCAHDSVSGKIEKPGEHQRDRKPEYDEGARSGGPPSSEYRIPEKPAKYLPP